MKKGNVSDEEAELFGDVDVGGKCQKAVGNVM